ncbi:MAG: hypothetical protein V4724_39180 [Pseudomonadota bacterium]
MQDFHIAEAKDVKFFAIEEVNIEGSTSLHIKGLVFHSAISVENVQVQKNQDSAAVLVAMTQAMPGLSGAFEVSVPLAGNIKTVLFGNASTPIWRREAAGMRSAVLMPS